MGKGRIENLIRNEDLTPEERRASARRAGLASGEARRRRKTLRELATLFGSGDAPDKVRENFIKQGVIDPSDELSNDLAVIIAQYDKAYDGNTRAATYIAEIKGERIQRIETMELDQSLEAMNEFFARSNSGASEDASD